MDNLSEWTREFAGSEVRDALKQAITAATPGIGGGQPGTQGAYLELLTATHLVSCEADRLLHEAIASALRAGLNWEQIGTVFGMTTDAVRARYDTDTPNGVVPLASASGLPPVGTRTTITGASDTNLAMLNRAGQYGWKVASFSASNSIWTLEFDNRQWQYELTSGKLPNGTGWERLVRYGFVIYWGRATHLPILPGNPEPSAFRSERKLRNALNKTSTISDSVYRGLDQIISDLFA